MTGKFGLGVQNEAGQRLIEYCQENALVTANTLFQQHKRRLYTWTSPLQFTVNNVGFVVSKEDLGSDQELGLITQSFCVTEVLLDEKGQRKLLT